MVQYNTGTLITACRLDLITINVDKLFYFLSYLEILTTSRLQGLFHMRTEFRFINFNDALFGKGILDLNF